MNPTPGWRFAAHWTASSVHGSFTVTVKAEKAAVSADRPLFSPKRNSAEAPLQGDEMQRSSMRLKGLSQGHTQRKRTEMGWRPGSCCAISVTVPVRIHKYDSVSRKARSPGTTGLLAKRPSRLRSQCRPTAERVR
ncbi:hypothetical protein VFPFJ_01514 [Purpureocillium lilacinum]|uniref:Uncharacterized protein n=1 Tax=Purpureocillium lilacinum TaxID=33203 RepID=A0A179HAX8_PURLI|nr:hypothetical protein VFPFJ_01514 [Purpureocillium lilacinum]OAQ87445.1 hypothetical protein VFPBJ_01485 [Purpureocillium lilacinum]OAQ95404.1 hypothetical protein VFPFJ_01514 [Purpureocillium lilacinum]